MRRLPHQARCQRHAGRAQETLARRLRRGSQTKQNKTKRRARIAASGPNFGTATERKRRWCAGCGEARAAIDLFIVRSKKQLPVEAAGADVAAAAGAPEEEEEPAALPPVEAAGADGADLRNLRI
eukprot:COSAG06_NODE_541_length_14471_cov_35.139229_4_plen_125_part_00